MEGIVDTWSEKMTMRSNLFQKALAVGQLKQLDFKMDKILHTIYNRHHFSLDGRMDMQISFSSSTAKLPSL